MDIAKRIIQLCEKQGISIYKLSELVGLTQSTVQNIVTGRNASMLVSTLERICEGLGISMSDFFAQDLPDTLPPEARQELKKFKEYLNHKYKK